MKTAQAITLRMVYKKQIFIIEKPFQRERHFVASSILSTMAKYSVPYFNNADVFILCKYKISKRLNLLVVN
jgi:hypothetical protein